MKTKGPSIVILILFLAGSTLLVYPLVSNFRNSLHQTQAISDYNTAAEQLTEETYTQLWTEAGEWNRIIAHTSSALGKEQAKRYHDLLDPNNRKIMGYLEIPSINVTLPIGHGTGEEVLQNSVGHLEWSSLPVGGEGTHCILSGHRGLPTARLLTDLNRLEAGDFFSLCVLNQRLDYMVSLISVVEPDDFSLLGAEPGKDLVTLVTCTPYGVNSHRLLVRGERVNPVEQRGAP